MYLRYKENAIINLKSVKDISLIDTNSRSGVQFYFNKDYTSWVTDTNEEALYLFNYISKKLCTKHIPDFIVLKKESKEEINLEQHAHELEEFTKS